MTENIGKFTDYGQPNFADFPAEPEPTQEEIAKAISHPVLTALSKRLENLQNERDTLIERNNTLADNIKSVRYDHDKKKLALKDVLVSLVEEEDLHYDNAKTIAEIFDILLTKRVEVEYKITATATLEVPINADPDEVADETFCDRVDFSTYNSDFEVLETDYDVEDWSIRS